jgi:hypothetical protein
MAVDDVSVDDSNAETLGVEQSVLDNINDVFSKADTAELDTAPEKVEPTPTAVPQRETARRAAVAKEQEEELIEEGKVDPLVPQGMKTAAKLAEQTKEAEPSGEAEAVVAEGEEAKDAAPATIDPNLRYVAQEFGWKDEKIDALFKADPELAQQTLQSLSDAYTNLSRQMVQPTQVAPAPVAQPAAQPQAPTSKLDQLYADLQSFAEENGDSVVERLLKPLKEEVIEPFRQFQAELQVQKSRAIAAEAGATISTLRQKFGDVYGDEGKASPAQQQTLSQLAQLADQIRSGAKAQGRELSVKDALNRAHLIVTADRRESDGRKQVQAQVQTRAKAIVARPTPRARPTAEGRSEAKAMEALERRAAELGIELD